jgi:outer membrane protein assembly factor BamB
VNVSILFSGINVKNPLMRHLKKVVGAYIFLILITSSSFPQSSESSLEEMHWVVETGGPVYASPVISEGSLYIGSTDSVFYAIEVGSGKVLWRYHAGNTIQSSAAVYKNLVFFESGNRLIALNSRGKLKWEKSLCDGEVRNQLDPWDYHHSSPCIHEGKVYIGTEQGILLGFDAKSGEQVLRSQTLSEQPIRTTPVIWRNLVIFGDWDGVLYASDISTGSLIWKYDTRKDGTYPWTNAILGSIHVTDSTLYFAGKSNRLYSLNARTGKKNWHYSSPSDQWLIGGPVVHKGTVYLGSSDQHIFHAIDAASGDIIWTTKMDCRTWGRAWVDEDKVYIGSNSLYAIDKGSGTILRQWEFPQVHEERKYGEYVDRSANFHSSPLGFKDMLILGSDDGSIYAIRNL